MNEDQCSAFNVYWAEVTANCEHTFPEVIEALNIQGDIAKGMMLDTPLADQRKDWIATMNATLQLMQVCDLEEDLWAKAAVFRWIVGWIETHGV